MPSFFAPFFRQKAVLPHLHGVGPGASALGNHAKWTAGPGLVGTLRKDTHTVLAMSAPGCCPVLAASSAVSTQARKSAALDEFAERVYTQIVSNGRD